MRALPYPDSPRGILSFDFDGTLLDPDSDPVLHPSFFEEIQRLRENGWVWGINTGRSEAQMKQGFLEGEFPFLPDFLVARERELFTPGEFGRWHPIEDWNIKVDKDHRRFFKKMRKPILKVKDFVISNTEAQWIEESGDPAAIIASSEAEMEKICEVIDLEASKFPTLGYLRNTIYLRFSHKDYHKGSSLAEVARRTGVSASNVFAAGDGHNDIEMLHRRYANFIACPANAHDDIREVVNAQEGYIAKGRGSIGMVEALNHFFPKSPI